MSTQQYLMINETTNIVESTCMWDGDTSTWMPPEGYLVIPTATTPAKVWEMNQEQTDYYLAVEIGAALSEFTWDGEYAITNYPKPEIIAPVETSGMQTL